MNVSRKSFEPKLFFFPQFLLIEITLVRKIFESYENAEMKSYSILSGVSTEATTCSAVAFIFTKKASGDIPPPPPTKENDE